MGSDKITASATHTHHSMLLIQQYGSTLVNLNLNLNLLRVALNCM